MDGIDDYYKRKQDASRREHQVLVEMIQRGASSEEISKQQQIALDAGDTGD